jgi:hypothetical protein
MLASNKRFDVMVPLNLMAALWDGEDRMLVRVL